MIDRAVKNDFMEARMAAEGLMFDIDHLLAEMPYSFSLAMARVMIGAVVSHLNQVESQIQLQEVTA